MDSTAPLLVIGLDGADFSVLDRLIEDGQLPCLRRLIEEGLRCPLLSTVPPVTLPAWTSFLTGVDASEHGITDLFTHPQHSYDLIPIHGGMRAVPTVLHHLSAQGFSVVSLGVPGTFPPEPINGWCVAGFDAPGAERARRDAFWPPSAAAEIQKLGGWRYATFNEHSRDPKRQQRGVDALLDDLDRKERFIRGVFRKKRWDFFFVHLQASDTVGHHLWHTFDPRSPRAPAHDELSDALPRVYRRLDRLIHALLSDGPPNRRVLIVSDHGMAGAGKTAIYLNRWLALNGWLTFRSPSARFAQQGISRLLQKSLGEMPPRLLGQALRWIPKSGAGALMSATRGRSIDFRGSPAFSDELDYAPSIWINRQTVFPHGNVSDHEALALTMRIAERLKDLKEPTTQRSLIKKVHLRTDFSGPFSDRYPDLTLEPHWPDGYRPSFLPTSGPGQAVRNLEPDEYAAPKGFGTPGVHRREGIFIAHGPDILAGRCPALTIAQAGALIYPLLGAVPPNSVTDVDVDQLLKTPTTISRVTARSSGKPKKDPVTPTPTLSEADRLLIAQRWRALGYM